MSRRLLLIDDHPLFVDGFAAMLAQFRPDWLLDKVSSAGAGRAMIAGTVGTALMPELAIVDIQLPDGDGFGTVGAMRSLDPALACVIISGREDAAARARAADCGARGFIAKTDAPEAIVDALEQVLAGGRVFDHAGQKLGALPCLSGRQGEVLALLAQGHANKEIRYRLGIAERTVRAHLTELFGLLGVSSRVQAILKAREIGLID